MMEGVCIRNYGEMIGDGGWRTGWGGGIFVMKSYRVSGSKFKDNETIKWFCNV